MNKIKDIRELRGLSQSELARRVGTTPSTISRLESGARKLTQEYLVAISRALDADPGDLIGKAQAAYLDVDHILPVSLAEAAVSKWSVPNLQMVSREENNKIPVMLPPEHRQLAGTAYHVTDDHAKDIVPKGGYAIAVPFDAVRKKPLSKDWLVVRSTEGRMERHAITKPIVDARGVHFDLGEGEVPMDAANWPVGLVVSTYCEL